MVNALVPRGDEGRSKLR